MSISKIIFFLTVIISMGFVFLEKENIPKDDVALSYSYTLDSDSSSLFPEQIIVSLDKEQAITFLLDSLSNDNIIIGFEYRFHQIRAAIDRNGVILSIEKVSDNLVPYLLQLLEDESKDWAVNIILYHKSRCIGANLVKYNELGYTYWQDSGRKEDYEKWHTRDWETEPR